MKNLKFLLMLLTLLITNNSTHAIEPLKPYRTEIAPKIDGVLDDPVWQKAPFETGFKTFYPDFGKNLSEQTIVWYAYDRENLYFAFMCYDSNPNKIKTSITARDKIRPDDYICINLDSFNDQQSLYAFYANPRGIQMDSRAIGENEDMDADFVWYSEGKINEHGYSIELRIPLKSIRFSSKEPVEMGVIFERKISRKSEAGTYPPLDPKWGINFNTQMRTLIFEGIKHYQLVEILPAVTYSQNSAIDQGKLKSQGEKSEISLTGKFGITSHLVLDGTYNPDYSQVEADAGQVDFNQRYALFYPEKRAFFLEGRENFFFGGYSPGDPLGAVVHTRMIANPVVGAKLTGKISTNNTLAMIYAMDELPEDLQRGKYAHFAILRYKRALSQDNYLGGFFTARELDNSYNRVTGADGQIRINSSSNISFHGFFSQSENKKYSIKDTGHALGLNYFLHNRDWYIVARVNDLSVDFNTETGFVTRTGIIRFRGGIIRRLYTNSKILKRIDPLLNNQFIYDKESEQWENLNGFFLTFILPRSSMVRAGYGYSTEIFLGQKFNTNYFSFITRSQFTKQLYFNVYFKYGNRIRYVSDPYQGKGNIASARLIYQPSDNFNSSLSYTYDDFFRVSDNKKEYDYTLIRFKNTYQVNKYFFFRAILEYNSFYEDLTTDFLASFTYIPGTVIHLGYGSIFERTKWQDNEYTNSNRLLETKRGFFFKTSYLWRM